MYSDMSMLDQRVLVAEQELGERPRELGLADARGAEEDERAGGRLGSLMPARARRIALRDGLDRRVLADDALVQLVLHAQELLGLGLGELEDRDAGPHRDDVGDLLLADRGALAGLAGLPLLLELALLVRQLALLVAEVRGLLELLRLDRGLLLGAASSRSPPRARDTTGGAVIVLMRMREAASSMRSMALSGRKRSEM